MVCLCSTTMAFEDFEPIFCQPKADWTNTGQDSGRQFVLQVHAPDSSHLRFFVTDFHSQSWESIHSISQLEDMRDNIGIAGSWSEFIDYMIASVKSEDVKLAFEGQSNSAAVKLVAQKLKGMPRIAISLRKLVDSAASEAISNLSLELFKAFKSMQHFYREEQHRTLELLKTIAEKERNESTQNQLYSKRQKSKENFSDKANLPAAINNGKDSPGIGSVYFFIEGLTDSSLGIPCFVGKNLLKCVQQHDNFTLDKTNNSKLDTAYQMLLLSDSVNLINMDGVALLKYIVSLGSLILPQFSGKRSASRISYL